jgi:hypothetical protein
MATVFTANQSAVQVEGVAVEGVQSVEYRTRTVRTDLYAIGSSERVDVVPGQHSVEGRIRVASSWPALDALIGGTPFELTVPLRDGESEHVLGFNECQITDVSFTMGVGGHAETVYGFTATRVAPIGAGA